MYKKNIYTNLLVIVALLLSSVVSYSQCMIKPITLSERVSNSSKVFEGKVLSKRMAWDEAHRKILTYNTVEVYRVFKGDISTSTVEVTTEGGVVGNEMLIVSSALELNVGEVGTFTLTEGDYGTSVPYASTQGFVKYDRVTGEAIAPMDKYASVDDLYSAITRITGEEETIIKDYATEANQTTSQRMATPIISGFSPTTAAAGTYTLLTINGSNFGSTAGDVEFGDADDGGATYITAAASLIQSWNDSQITIYVPEGATTGNIRVTNSTSQTGTSSGTLTVPYNISGLNSSGTDYTADLVNNNGSGGYTFTFNTNYYSNTDAVNRYDEVIEQWRCETGINWGSNGASTTSIACEGSDGTNVVTFDNSCGLSAGVLGTCYSYYSGCSTGTLYWRVNELDVKFDAGTNWNFTSGSPTGSQYDFYSVMLHEMGHGHQLGHVPDNTDVMYYSIANGVEKRTLNANNSTAGNYVMTRTNANESSYAGSTGGSTVANACGTGPMVSNGCSIAPTTGFSADATGTCGSSLSVNFTDESVGSPTSWNWDFGDGNTSTSQNPSHNYTTSGSYDVTLITSNAYGSDTLVKTGYISLGGAAPTASTCSPTPTTVNTGNFGTGIDQFDFHTISNSHTDNTNDGLQDFTCSNIAFVDVNTTYAFTVTGSGGNPEYCRIYIDYNNDGAYDAGEIVFNNMSTRETSHSGNITIPASPSVTGTTLRMRVMTDYFTFSSGCVDMEYGEIEDYGVYINTPPCTPPSVTGNPSNSTICETANTSFSVTASDATGYQWQENDGGGFTNITNGGVYSGATTATLSITGATSGMDGYTYRCVVTGACTPDATSNSATLNVTALPNDAGSITGSTSECANATGVTYSIAPVTGATSYGWTVPTGATITSGAGTEIITVDFGSNSGNVEVTPINSCGNGNSSSVSVTISSVTPTASVAIASGSNPTCAGSSISFHTTITNGGGSPRYIYYVNGSEVQNAINGHHYTTSSLTDGDQVQSALVSSASCITADTVWSNVITITVTPSPSISSNPSNSTINENDNTTFTVTASNATGYQWQENDGGGFTNITNGGVYSGATSATLSLTSVPQSMDTYTYRCVVSGTCSPNATSNSATLTVNAAAAGASWLAAPYDGKVDQPTWGNMWAKKQTGATSYNLQLSTDPGFASIDFDWNSSTNKFANYSGLAGGTTYYARVITDLDASYGITTSFTTVSSLNCQITSPVDDARDVAMTAYIWVNWQETGVDQIDFQVATDNSFNNIVYSGSNTTGSPVSRTSPSMTDMGLSKGTRYYARARSHNGGSTGSYSATVTFKTINNLYNKITHPLHQAVDVGLGERIWCNYQDAGVDQIFFQIATDVSFTNIVATQTNDVVDSNGLVKRTTHTLDSLGLVAGTTYFVRAKSYDLPTAGVYSSTVRFTTAGAARAARMGSSVIEKEALITNYSVYPNPFSEAITIQVESKKQENLMIRITDLTGKVVYMSARHQTNQIIQLGEDLETGMYLIQLTHGDQTKLMKVVKK